MVTKETITTQADYCLDAKIQLMEVQKRLIDTQTENIALTVQHNMANLHSVSDQAYPETEATANWIGSVSQAVLDNTNTITDVISPMWHMPLPAKIFFVLLVVLLAVLSGVSLAEATTTKNKDGRVIMFMCFGASFISSVSIGCLVGATW